MPTATYTPLANITLSSSTSMISFTSISQAYRDLVLVSRIKVGSSGADVGFTVNSSSLSNTEHSRVYFSGDGANPGTGSNYGLGLSLFTYPNNVEFSSDVLTIFDYSTTNKHKSWMSNVALNGYVVKYAGRSMNTAAVSSMYIQNISSTTFAAGSSFALYGVSA